MASGYGRGGRGAALLQALQQPTRKPGQPSSTTPENAELTQSIPIGRGMASLLPSQTQQQPTPVLPGAGRGLPMGRGLAGLPLGRKGPAPTTQAGGGVDAPTTTVMPVGRGMVPVQAFAGRGGPMQSPVARGSPMLPEPSKQPTAAVSPTPQARKEAGDHRPTKLEYMLQEMKLDEKAVIRKGEDGQRIPLNVNYIQLKCRNEGVYQYAVTYVPTIDSSKMRYKMLEEHLDVIGETKAFDGAILFLPIRLPQQETTVTSHRQADGQEVQIKIKFVKVLPYSACKQLYNVLFRRVMTILKMCEVGRHFYDPHRPAQIPQHRLEVWPGYVTAVDEYEGGLMLMTDVSHKVLRMETALDLIRDCIQTSRNFKDDIMRKLIGTTVLTRYNNKTYRVDDIMWDKNPTSTFDTSRGPVTFMEYYRRAYNKEIRDAGQPLLVHRPKRKEMQGKRVLEMICLVPELCYITGLTDEMRNDRRVMKDLGTHTRVMPMQRQRALRQFVENVNSKPEARALLENWGLELMTDTLQVEGRLLKPENILFGKGYQCSAGSKASWSQDACNNAVLTAVNLDNWLVIFTNRNGNEARSFMQMMDKVAHNMGIHISKPEIRELQNDRTESYTSAIRDSVNPKMQLVVTIFPTSRDDRYNAIKKLCCVDCEVASQVLLSRTLKDPRKLRSVTQKVALQINCKLGGELWAVKIPTKALMVVGIDTYHEGSRGAGKRPSVGGMVASINSTCTRWYSRVCFQQPGQELIDGLKVCFTAALRKFHEVNHVLPETIVIYRDGVGDGQLKTLSSHEVKQMAECFLSFGEGYQPRFAFIVVQKKINQRMFAEMRQGRDICLENPPPGTVLDHTITRKLWYDFFLVSQHVTQGTVSPTHYIVVHDSSNWKVDILQKLTYKMTHLYYNWPGTIRVPAPCQYAHKLAYQVGENIRKDPSHLLSDRLFFL